MDKETIALIIAQNGLGTAASILAAKATRLQKLAAKETDTIKLAALNKQIRCATKASAALKAANDGIAEYQAETAA